MQRDSAAPVRQSDRTSKDDPDETELKPATCVTNGGRHDENQQQSTSHVTPTCLKDKAETSSFYSGENSSSSTYPDFHRRPAPPPPPLPMAPCNPSLMRRSSEVKDALPILPLRQETHDDDDDYDDYESCEPSLMSDAAAEGALTIPPSRQETHATSSFYSGENNNSSTYSDSPPPPLPRRAPMAPCNPSLMRLSSEVEDAQPIPPSRRETHDDDDDDADDDDDDDDDDYDIRFYVSMSCEPSLMTDDAADYVENYETEALQPRTMFKASCEPSRMASFPDLEALEMKTIIHETHAGKDDSRAFGQRRLSADVETARVQAKATSAPALTEARIASGGWSEWASETDPDADKVKVRRTQSTPLLSTINSEQTNSSVDYVDNTTSIEATDFFRKVVKRYFGLIDILFVLVFGIVLYVVDVGSDVMAAVVYFQEGHRVWGSLTITFVVASAFCWATVSWTWWYRDDKDRTKRRMRMMLAVLLLDPLVR